MQKIENKKYSEAQGRSFDHLMDKNGQFKLKDVAEFLEKSASGLTNMLIKLGSAAQFAIPTYNTEPKPQKTESQYDGNKGAREYAAGVNNTAKNASVNTLRNHVGPNAGAYLVGHVSDNNNASALQNPGGLYAEDNSQMTKTGSANLSQNNIGNIMDRETVHKILQKRAADACSKEEPRKETRKLEPYMKKEMPKVASAITREMTHTYLTNRNEGSLYKCASDLQKIAIAPLAAAALWAGRHGLTWAARTAIPWLARTGLPALGQGAKWIGSKALGLFSKGGAKAGAKMLGSKPITDPSKLLGFKPHLTSYGALGKLNPSVWKDLAQVGKEAWGATKAATPYYLAFEGGRMLQGMNDQQHIDDMKQAMELGAAGYDPDIPKYASSKLVKQAAALGVYDDRTEAARQRVIQGAAEDAKKRGLIFQPIDPREPGEARIVRLQGFDKPVKLFMPNSVKKQLEDYRKRKMESTGKTTSGDKKDVEQKAKRFSILGTGLTLGQNMADTIKHQYKNRIPWNEMMDYYKAPKRWVDYNDPINKKYRKDLKDTIRALNPFKRVDYSADDQKGALNSTSLK